jgi:hypothetical protein
MNLIDDLGNDLAIAFLVEKKYSKKIDTEESLALIGKIKEVLHQASSFRHGENEVLPAASKSAGNRGN